MSEKLKMRKKRTKQLEEAVWMARCSSDAMSEEELKRRVEEKERQDEYLMSLGINVHATIDVDNETEDIDKLDALICVMNNEPVPEELERKLLEKEILRKERELHYKQKKLSNRERKQKRQEEENLNYLVRKRNDVE